MSATRWFSRVAALLLALVVGVAGPTTARASVTVTTPGASQIYAYDAATNSSLPIAGRASSWLGGTASEHGRAATLASDLSCRASRFVAAETGDAAVTDVGHAGVHQYPGVTAGKSQFFDGENLGGLSNTDGVTGVLQKNGNTRFVMRGSQDVGVDRTTGLPANVYSVIRKPDGSVLTMFPGTSPKS